jgi:hypothetical protein
LDIPTDDKLPLRECFEREVSFETADPFDDISSSES